MSHLTGAEQALAVLIWTRLCAAYPTRCFAVEVRRLTPAPEPGWLSIAVAASDRVVRVPLARDYGGLAPGAAEADALLRVIRARLDHAD